MSHECNETAVFPLGNVVSFLSRLFPTATATEHGCCLIPQCPWIANFLERHCYRAWLSSDQGDVCSALSRDLVLSTRRLAVEMQM